MVCYSEACGGDVIDIGYKTMSLLCYIYFIARHLSVNLSCLGQELFLS